MQMEHELWAQIIIYEYWILFLEFHIWSDFLEVPWNHGNGEHSEQQTANSLKYNLKYLKSSHKT